MNETEKLAVVAAASVLAGVVVTSAVVAIKKLRSDRAYNMMIDAAEAEKAAIAASIRL